MVARMDPKEELSQELRRARGWILAVGILMFVFDTIIIQVIGADQYSSAMKTQALFIDLGVLAFFVALWAFAKKYPKPCCLLALIGYWAIQIAVLVISGDPTTIYKGILIKVLFTVALVRGLKSATRATYLKEELEKVFG